MGFLIPGLQVRVLPKALIMNKNIEIYKECLEQYYEIHNYYHDFYKKNFGDNAIKLIVVEGPDKTGKTTYINRTFVGKDYVILKDEVFRYNDNLDTILGFSVVRNNNLVRIFQAFSEGKTIVYDRFFYSTFVYNILYKVFIGEKIVPYFENNVVFVSDMIRFVFSMAAYIFPEKILFFRRRLRAIDPRMYYENAYDQDLLLKIYNDVLNPDKITVPVIFM